MLNSSFLPRLLAGAALAGACCAATMLFPARAADTSGGIPELMQTPGVAWEAYRFGFRAHPPGPDDVAYDRTANEWQAPLSGIGPITADPAHPFYNNAVAADLHVSSTYRVADLNNEAAKNLKPWAVEALKKQNALTLAGRNGETRQARCWETGVPNIHEAPQMLYFIQTPREVVMYQGHRTRHVYFNVGHSKNPVPSWYGESVGHYEGDSLIVDTIGQIDQTFVDGYRTPHTTQLHVVERFSVVNGGKGLDVSFTVDDPGTFYRPWGGRRPRYRADGAFGEGDPAGQICAAGSEDRFNLGFDPLPHADAPDF